MVSEGRTSVKNALTTINNSQGATNSLSKALDKRELFATRVAREWNIPSVGAAEWLEHHSEDPGTVYSFAAYPASLRFSMTLPTETNEKLELLGFDMLFSDAAAFLRKGIGEMINGIMPQLRKTSTTSLRTGIRDFLINEDWDGEWVLLTDPITKHRLFMEQQRDVEFPYPLPRIAVVDNLHKVFGHNVSILAQRGAIGYQMCGVDKQGEMHGSTRFSFLYKALPFGFSFSKRRVTGCESKLSCINNWNRVLGCKEQMVVFLHKGE